MKKKIWTGIFIGLAGVVIIIWALTINAGPDVKKIQYGVTFSVPYAVSLGLNWKDVYNAMLTDLQVKNIRIPVYWDEVEPTSEDNYNFSDIDYMLQQAQANQTSVILAVGKRLPRWPECHEPDWANQLPQASQDNDLLSLIETTVNKYKNDPTVTMWQVENEPFLSNFGPCPKLDVTFFDSEIALVRKLDPSRPILITDSGELSSWIPAGTRADVFGTTYYRYVYSDVLHRYWTNFYFPFWYYRLKGGIVRLFNPHAKIIIAELEAEPWTTDGITSTPLSGQFQTMSLDHFKTITHLAAETGYSPQYLWGVEWWYWVKQQGHPEFWDYAKSLFTQ